jgi:arabinofuranosyltransferase
MPPTPRGDRTALAVLLALLGVWGAWFIYRTSFLVGGERWFCLFDDAMISMTYARNLIDGHGFAWARWGEPVEGFTHPLWTFLMIPVNALPVPLRDRGLWIQILSLLTLAGTVVAARRLVVDHFSLEGARHWMPAAVLTAFCHPLAYWSLMGMETGLQALLAVLAVHFALDIAYGGRDRHLALWIVCAAAFLLRMDMLLLVIAAQLQVLLRGGIATLRRRSWLLGLATFLGASLAYELFRWVHFHDLLPNTYYLKLAGVPFAVRLLRGLDVLTGFLRDHLWIVLPALLGAGALARRNPRVALPAAVFVLYCAYTVYVGGDAWDGDLEVRANRFIAFVLPLLFVVLNAMINQVLAAWNSREEAGRFAVAAVTALALLIANGLWLSDKADGNWKNLALTERPRVVARHQRVVTQLQSFQRIVRPGATVAVAWAGIPAYFTDYKLIDILGYNDRVVARLPPAVPLTEDDYKAFRPGHVKWSQARLLREQRPDAFFQTWGIKRGMSRIAEALPRRGYRQVKGFWLRKDSPYVSVKEGPKGRKGPKGPKGQL